MPSQKRAGEPFKPMPARKPFRRRVVELDDIGEPIFGDRPSQRDHQQQQRQFQCHCDQYKDDEWEDMDDYALYEQLKEEVIQDVLELFRAAELDEDEDEDDVEPLDWTQEDNKRAAALFVLSLYALIWTVKTSLQLFSGPTGSD